MGVHVYMLRCSDGSYYIGCANDLQRRIGEHETGHYKGYTASRLPVHLEWSGHFECATDAIAVERQLKGWSRAKKEALMRGEWTTVALLAKRRGGRDRK